MEYITRVLFRKKILEICSVIIIIGIFAAIFAWFFFGIVYSATYSIKASPGVVALTEPQKQPIGAFSAPLEGISLSSLISSRAGQIGANPVFVTFVAKHEGNNDPDAVGDKDFVCNLPRSPLYGKISPSYGLAQINRCAHADISIASATDPIFAIDFIARQFVNGTADIFSAWRFRCSWFRESPNCP